MGWHIPSSRGTKLVVGATSATVLLLGAAGLAGAAIPSSDGTVTVCKARTGVLKAINADGGATCPAGSKRFKLQSGQDPLTKARWVSAETETSTSLDKSVSATCPDGMWVVGGGAQTLKPGVVAPSFLTDAFLRRSYPADTRWYASARNLGSTTDEWYLQVRALCAPGVGMN